MVRASPVAPGRFQRLLALALKARSRTFSQGHGTSVAYDAAKATAVRAAAVGAARLFTGVASPFDRVERDASPKPLPVASRYVSSTAGTPPPPAAVPPPSQRWIHHVIHVSPTLSKREAVVKAASWWGRIGPDGRAHWADPEGKPPGPSSLAEVRRAKRSTARVVRRRLAAAAKASASAGKPGSPLDELIDPSVLECLNQDDRQPVQRAFEDGDAFLASDAEVDHELLVKVQFTQPVKLSAIRILAGPDSSSAPTVVKVFQSRPTIGFDDAADEEPTQELVLSDENVLQGEPVPLRYVKFQSVRNLQLFFGENNGGEQTQVRRIQFLGEPATNMDMKDWKPCKS